MNLDKLNAAVTYNEEGQVVSVDHSAEPYTVKTKNNTTDPASISATYLKQVIGLDLVRNKPMPSKMEDRQKKSSRNEDELWLSEVKNIGPSVVVGFDHYYNGLLVKSSGVSVMLNSELQVMGATLDRQNLKGIEVDLNRVMEYRASFDEGHLEELLDFKANLKRLYTIKDDILRRDIEVNKKVFESEPKLRINNLDEVIFEYREEERQHEPHASKNEDLNLVERALHLSLPKIKGKIPSPSQRAAIEVRFTGVLGSLEIHWHAYIDVENDAVLYIRPEVDFASGFVFDRDPLTTTGDPAINASASTALLNSARTPRPFNVTSLPDLKGEYVAVQEVCPITAAPPTSGTGEFDYDADSDDFSAVNAYYHSDGVFRMVEEMGFDMNVYFDGTSFPVPVDHRGSFACVNAAAWGNGGGNGLGSFTFGLVQAGQPVGIANAVRVVLHEFGHAVLWDNVSSPNFGFAHSCGDSLAALICDPGSKAPDRFQTFPWVALSTPALARRHDRDVASGWAWGGVNDDGGYDSEQILSTSHFRAYLSLGGGSGDRCDQEWASRYMTYLIIHGVGTLTPATNPSNPEAWSDRLQLCDKITDVFEGHPGGAVHKVVRWAFEQQGAYQPLGTPTPVTSVGAPPKYDVYINDGRNGEYDYTEDFCFSTDIWNRLCPDGNPAHQQPIEGIENYAHVIVRNRGAYDAKQVSVRAFQLRDNDCCGCCDDCQNLSWPKDFIPTLTEEIMVDQIPAGGYKVVGPFKWKPGAKDCLMMAADTKGDHSNLQFITPGNNIPAKRLIPFDNNLAMRCMCKSCNPDFSKLQKKPHWACKSDSFPIPQ